MEEKIIVKGVANRMASFVIPIVAVIIGGLSLLGSITVASSAGAENVLIIVGIAFIVLAIIAFLYFTRSEITVTNKRVYGKAAFGKRVDLPINSISAVGMSSFNGISVGTSSGRVSFLYISNSDEIHKAINDLVLNKTDNNVTTIRQEMPQSNADELKKYKELLDQGIISQEEFDAKKKQLLGL